MAFFRAMKENEPSALENDGGPRLASLVDPKGATVTPMNFFSLLNPFSRSKDSSRPGASPIVGDLAPPTVRFSEPSATGPRSNESENLAISISGVDDIRVTSVKNRLR